MYIIYIAYGQWPLVIKIMTINYINFFYDQGHLIYWNAFYEFDVRSKKNFLFFKQNSRIFLQTLNHFEKQLLEQLLQKCTPHRNWLKKWFGMVFDTLWRTNFFFNLRTFLNWNLVKNLFWKENVRPSNFDDTWIWRKADEYQKSIWVKVSL